MPLATPADMRANFGAEEVANLTRLYMEATGDTPEGAESRSEEEVLAWAVTRASSRAVSYVAARFPVLTGAALPHGVTVPPALINAVCDIARYYLTGTPVQETDPITERYKDAIAWLKEVASGMADLPGLSGDDEDAERVADAVTFVSGTRQWSASA